jgi:preprotein translocase subunit SecE
MANETKKSNSSFVDSFDHVMGKVRHFFVEIVEEMKRCTWPSKSNLIESTLLVIVAMVGLAVFVAVVDIIARYFVKFITTGTF